MKPEYQSGLKNVNGAAVHVAADYASMSRAAGDWLADAIQAKPDSLLCLATGASPTGTYARLAEQCAAKPELFKKVRCIKLDEWGGLPMDDQASSEFYLRKHVLGPLRVDEQRYFAWNSRPLDQDTECRRVVRWMQSNGPISIAIIGMGLNGHVGFNEPADFLPCGPHSAELSLMSQQHSMLGDKKGKIHSGYTLGLDDILRSRKILLLVSGVSKAEPMRELFSRRITTRFPASLLWSHPNLSIFCDQASTSLIPE
jgi:galactosamine-6-phosphate isomerase